MKLWLAIAVLVAAALVPDGAEAQRGMRLGGGSPRMGGGVRGSVPMVRGGAGFGNRGAFIGSRGFAGNRGVFIGNRGFGSVHGFGNRGFVDPRFRGGMGFGHHPRFHAFFGNSCFNNPFFCGGFGSGFFNSGFFPWGGFGLPFYGGYPIYYGGYGYPLDYDQYYNQSQAASPSPQAYQQDAYQQGVMSQQVQDLTNEVERLRSEMDARNRETSRAYAPVQERPVQELPLNVTLVLRDGRRMQIHNYAIVGHTIWIFDEQTAKKMTLAQLDLNATKRVNEENGVLFLLPGMR
jgi:hypothetical protein